MTDNKRPVSLEDLLRLKRAEQPEPAFWTEFDRQLRAKQLAALVERRPWWHSIRHAAASLGRYQVYLGAAAVVAITFVSLRTASDSTLNVVDPIHRIQVAAPMSPAASSAMGSSSRAVISEDASAALESEVAQTVSSGGAGSTQVATSRVSAISSHDHLEQPQDNAGPTAGRFASAGEQELDTPSARFIAANLAAAQSTISVGLLADAQGFESRVLPARIATVEPLQQMIPPGEVRRSSRFLAAMVSTAAAEVSPRTAERVASRISADELYEQVRRFGTRHGGVNMKF